MRGMISRRRFWVRMICEGGDWMNRVERVDRVE